MFIYISFPSRPRSRSKPFVAKVGDDKAARASCCCLTCNRILGDVISDPTTVCCAILLSSIVISTIAMHPMNGTKYPTSHLHANTNFSLVI